MRISGLIVVIMLLSGCAAHDSKPDRPTCNKPGYESDMRCRKKKRPPQDLVQICETHVISRNCYYVTRQELERAILEAQGQR